MEHLVVMILVSIFPVVWSGDWRVKMENKCALRGTSVVIKCSYDYPKNKYVQNYKWFWESFNFRGLLLRTSPRFVYVGDREHDCSLKINNIQLTDNGKYYFRFETYSDGWTSKSPAYVQVKELIASIEPRTVTEEDDVRLICQSGCNTQENIQTVWFREGQRLTTSIFKAGKEHSGSYTCALWGQEHVKSQPVFLNVHYAPKKVRLSVSPSEQVIQGTKVVFTCNSEANPPVAQRGYSLFKDGTFIGSGSSSSLWIISNVQPRDRGQYHCQAENSIIWKGGSVFQSTKVFVNVQYRPMNISISVNSTEVTEGSDMTLICSSVANPPASDYTWYKLGCSSSSPNTMVRVGSGSVLSLSSVEASDTGNYICQVSNIHGEDNSTELLLSVKTKDKATYVSILVGTGVSVLMALVLALLVYWKKQKRHSEKKQTTVCSDRCSTSLAGVETADHIYANACMFQRSSAVEKENCASPEEVFYTTLNIKPKKPSQKRHTQTTAPEMDDSVIYADVTKSS